MKSLSDDTIVGAVSSRDSVTNHHGPRTYVRGYLNSAACAARLERFTRIRRPGVNFAHLRNLPKAVPRLRSIIRFANDTAPLGTTKYKGNRVRHA